jgi:hypothetical protein
MRLPPPPALPQCESVWDCFSLEPKDRDAPFLPPANLAHLTPAGEPALLSALCIVSLIDILTAFGYSS